MRCIGPRDLLLHTNKDILKALHYIHLLDYSLNLILLIARACQWPRDTCTQITASRDRGCTVDAASLLHHVSQSKAKLRWLHSVDSVATATKLLAVYWRLMEWFNGSFAWGGVVGIEKVWTRRQKGRAIGIRHSWIKWPWICSSTAVVGCG